MRTLDELVAGMQEMVPDLRARRDPRRHFHATYLRTTQAVRDELAAGGFLDPAWVERWAVTFAGLYLAALAADRQGAAVSGPWALALAPDAGTPLQRVLLGMNAHINYDLPQALVAVIGDAEFDDETLLARREADHRHVDRVLAHRVDAEKGDMRLEYEGPVPRERWRDRLLDPLNRTATKHFLSESRTKVWHNARVLARARRQGSAAYESGVAELARLAVARAVDLRRPGPVLLRLGVRGFGVVLRAS